MSKKWVLSIIIVLIVLVVSAQIILQNPFFSEKIRKFAETALEEALGEAVSIEHVRLRLFPSSLKLTGFSIHSHRKDTPDVLFAKEVQISFSPESLFTEAFVIRAIEIRSPVVTLTVSPEGALPFFKKDPKKPENGTPPVIIRAVRIHDGQFLFKGEGFIKELSFSEILCEINPNLKMDEFEIGWVSKKGRFLSEGMTRDISEIEAELYVQSGKVLVKKAVVAAGRARFRAEGVLDFEKQDPLDLHLDLQVPIEMIADSGLSPTAKEFLTAKGISGEMAFTGALTGAFPSVKLTGKIGFPKFLLANQEVGSLEADILYHENHVSLSGVSGQFFSGAFSGEAHARFASENAIGAAENSVGGFEAKLKYRDLPLDRLLVISPWTEQFKDLSLKGFFVTGDVAVSGAGMGDFVQAAGTVEAKRLPLFSPAVPEKALPLQKLALLFESGKLHWRWSSEGLALEKGELVLPGTVLVFSGKWEKTEGLVLETALNSQDVGKIAETVGLPLTGALNAKGVLSQREGIPSFQGGIHFKSGALRGQTFTSFISDVDLQGRRVGIKKAVLNVPAKTESDKPASPAGVYTAAGTLNLDDLKSPQFDFKVEVDSGNPQEVFQFVHLDIPLYATGTGTLLIRGVPQAFFVKGLLDVSGGSLYGQSFEKGRVDLTVTEKEVLLKNTVLFKKKSLLAGEGAIRYDHTYWLALKGERLRIEDTELLHGMPKGFSAGVGLVVSGKGSFEKPAMKFVAVVNDLNGGGFSSARGTVKVDWHDRVVGFSGDFPDKKITMTGEVQIAPLFPFSFEGSFEQFRFDPLLKTYFSGLISEVVLSTSGNLRGNGNLSQLSLVSLSGQLTELSADFGEYQIQNDGPLAIQAREGAFFFQNTRFKGENTALVLNGGFTLLKHWGLFIKGEADLNLVTFFSKKISSGRGKMLLDLEVSDQWASPRLRGELTLKDGKIRTVNLSQPVEVTTLSALFNERQVILENLQGRLGGGDFHITGKAALAGFKAEDFGFLLEVKKVRMDVSKDLAATFDGELFFQKKGPEQTLKGELSIKNAVYDKKLELKQLILDLIKKRENRLSEETPVIGRTKINIHFYGKEEIRIENNLARIPLVIDLFVKGSFDEPQVIGRVDLSNGEIYFRQNTFRVISGSVDFLNPEELNPIFDLTARTDVRNVVTDRNYAIDLNLSGTLSQITLTWNAFPALPEADILALLAVGKTTADLADAGGRAGAEATTFVVSEFFAEPVDQITGMVGEPVQKITGIDRIRVEPSVNETRTNATVGTRLTAEKRLMNDRLVVIYQTTLDPSEEEVIRMVYEVNKHISLVGKREEDGQLGGDIRFRFEFR